jgi:ubiquitin carboxyl-terminal hydrolase 14
MSQYKVKVRWSNGKKEFDNLDLNLSEPPNVFKAQLYTLTGVPIDRQRLMCSGLMIKDDVWPDKLKIDEATTFMLMGSAEKLPEAPAEKPKFVEDLSENELAAAMDLPAGLTNLGNTCYMSATIQCLKVVPEFREALKKFDANLSIMSTLTNQPDNESVTAALRDLYKTMDETSAVVEPVILLRMLHLAIPRFAQRGEGNVFQQQDANECWTELTRILQQYLKPLNESSKYSNFIDEYFSGVLECELKCDESPDEPVTKSNESFLQLSCFISQDVRYLQAGLISRMKETITKFSPSLNRDASYTKVSRISRLPAYLTIQMVRFHYKGNVQTNAKLLRDVKFSMILDVYDLCTKELQEKLAPARLQYKNADDLIATSKSSKTVEADQPRGFPDDPGSNNSGFYELRAVLTHKGRSSASGHYVAWIKKEDQWYKCDDDYVEPIDSEEILKLSGGGDWHCAYVLLYGPRTLGVPASE